MIYRYNQKISKQILGAGSALAVGGVMALAMIGGGFATAPNAAAKTVADTSICNTATSFSQWDVSFPDGTIKAGVNPNFLINAASVCPVQFNVRIVSVSTGYSYDSAVRQYVPTGFSRSETSREMTVKPGVNRLNNKLGEHTVNQVTQMVTVMSVYHSSSFDANGRLLPGATPLASDSANWTQTNFITL